MDTMASITAFAPGLHADVPASVYHRRELGVANTGALKMLTSKTPAHYRAWIDAEQQEDTAALAFGKALHCALLEPAVYGTSYVEARAHPFNRVSDRQRNAKKPSSETLEAIAYWDAWEAELSGRIEISADDAKRIEGMRASILTHPIASQMVFNAKAEQTAIWNDPRTGLFCKARWDAYRPDLAIIGDVKTTEDASPGAFARSIARYSYHLQQAHYVAGHRELGLGNPDFVFVVQEKEPPYAVGAYMLDENAIGRGIELRERAMDLMDKCLREDRFPGYGDDIQPLSLPAWAFYD